MPHAFNTIPTILKYAGKLAWYPLSFYYNAKRLDSYLFFEITASGEPITYNYHSQEAQCMLRVYNISPFDYTIDRLEIKVVLDGGASFSCTNMVPVHVRGSSQKEVFVRSSSPMNPGALVIAKKSTKAWVNIEAYIVTSMHKFEARRHVAEVRNAQVWG